MHADQRGTCALINVVGNKCGGACGRTTSCQMGLAAGAVVVVDADNDRAVMVATTDHWALPLKGQVPTCPCFLNLRLDLQA